MNKEYLSNISNFWNAFLLNSQIKSKATHLSKCLKQVMKTITNFGNITQDISNNINSQGVTGLLSSLYSLNTILKDTKKEDNCINLIPQIKQYISYYLLDPKVGKGDEKYYITKLVDNIRSKTDLVYYHFKKSAALFNRNQFENSGNVVGDLFYHILNLSDFDEEHFDWDSYNKIIGNMDKLKEKEEAALFNKRFKSCIDSLELLLFDINNYKSYDKDNDSKEIFDTLNSNLGSLTNQNNKRKIMTENKLTSKEPQEGAKPQISDLFKYVFEIQQVVKCFNGISKTLIDLGKA